MLRNYLTIAYRNLRRRPGYAAINVTGLAVGMACCLLIGLYVRDELSYDDFHEEADRLMVTGIASDFFGRMTNTPYPLASALEAELPEVEEAVTMRDFGEQPVIREASQMESERRVLIADPAFFEMFTFPLVRGNPSAALDAPDAAVITQETAHAYFGEENPLGKTLSFERFDSTYTVTVRGVAQNVPSNSTIQFDLVAPLQVIPAEQRQVDSWGALMYQTYLLLEEGASTEALDQKMQAVVGERMERESNLNYFAVPLTSLYLSELHTAQGFKGQARYLYIFGSIALFVLLIAAINYVNLVTAQAARRAKEVGVRKTLGAYRAQVARQFLGESVMLSGGALLIALVLTVLALPAFNAFFQTELSLSGQGRGAALLGLAAFVLGVSVAAGAYPAFVLSRFHPVRVLRGSSAVRAGGGLLRKGLVVVQFAVTVALIIGTAVIYQQLHYAQTTDLGFDGAQVVVAQLPGDRAWQQRATLRRNVLAHPGVAAVTVANGVPSDFRVRLGLKPETWSDEAQPADPEKTVTFAPAVVDYHYIETLGLNLVAGRGFSREISSDEARAYILNETAAEALGWTPEEAVGKAFSDRGDIPGEVIGVVEDFHLQSLRTEIEPIWLALHESEGWSAGGMLVARLAPGRIRAAMDHIEAQVTRFAPEAQLNYEFLDESFDAMYRSERRLAQIFTSFAGLAILIACLGLFGLATYAAESRTKEIGIRKVLGASVPSIVLLLSKDFLKLVVIGFVLAVPVAYFAMQRWLEDFAYRIELGAGIFLLAGALALVIALATVSYQAIKAALADPVDALRYE